MFVAIWFSLLQVTIVTTNYKVTESQVAGACEFVPSVFSHKRTGRGEGGGPTAGPSLRNF